MRNAFKTCSLSPVTLSPAATSECSCLALCVCTTVTQSQSGVCFRTGDMQTNSLHTLGAVRPLGQKVFIQCSEATLLPTKLCVQPYGDPLGFTKPPWIKTYTISCPKSQHKVGHSMSVYCERVQSLSWPLCFKSVCSCALQCQWGKQHLYNFLIFVLRLSASS